MKTRVFHGIFISSACLALALSAPVAKAEDIYDGYVTVGGKFSSDRSIGETQVFIPILQDPDHLLFGDIRYKTDSIDAWEGNAGLGYRTILGNTFVLGGYAFLDFKNTSYDNAFRQLTLGAELLTENQDLRLNLYLPEQGKKMVSNVTSVQQGGTQLFFQNSVAYEKSAAGFDAEFGQKIPIPDLDLRFYGGFYHFAFDGDDMNGVRGRLRWETDSFQVADQPFNFRLSAEAQHDNIRGGEQFLGVELVIPFGDKKTPARSKTAIQTRMTEPLVRDVDVVTQVLNPNISTTAARTTIDGQEFSEVHVIALADGNALQTAIDAIPENSAIILDPAAPITMTNSLTFRNRQALLAPTSPIGIFNSGNSISSSITPTGRVELTKGNVMANATPIIELQSGSTTRLINIDLRSENGTNGDDMVMISNNGNAITSLILDNVRSDGAVVVDTPSGASTVRINGGELNGAILRTRGTASMDVSITNAILKRSFARADTFGQNISSLAFFESLNNSLVTVSRFAGNTLIDDDAKTGGRAALGIGFVNSSSQTMQVHDVLNNDISRTNGTWDAGAILGQGSGAGLVNFTHIAGNVADPFETINIRINIGEAGFTADEAGLEAANPGMDMINYGNVLITNTP